MVESASDRHRPELVGCGGCPSAGSCETAIQQGQTKSEGLQGRSFATAALGYFLGPLVLAWVGAAAGNNQVAQFIGAAVGFALGMGTAVVVANRRRAGEEAACLQH